MEKKELIEALKKIKYMQETKSGGGDFEDHHLEADALLLQYINDKDISNAFFDIEKWYS